MDNTYPNKFIINLEKHSDRLINTLHNLRKIGFNEQVTRIEGVTSCEAKKMEHKILSKKAFENIKNKDKLFLIYNYNLLGKSLSHLKCWQIILDKKLTGSFIIEDTIKIIDKYKFKIELNELFFLIKKYHNKSLFLTINSEEITKFQNTDNNYLFNFSFSHTNFNRIETPFIGLQFYYINYSMAKNLLNNIYTLDYPLDLEIGLIASNNRFRDCRFINYKTNTLTKRTNIISESNFPYDYKILSNIFNIFPIEIFQLIYQFIPIKYKRKRYDIILDNINYLLNNDKKIYIDF